MHRTWIFIFLLFFPTLNAHCTKKLNSADWYECTNISPEKLRQDIRIAHRYSFFTKLNITYVNLQVLNEQLFSDVVQVYEISIVECNVTKILPYTFNSKLDLRSLKIVNNNVKEITENMFLGNNLMALNLTNNNIRKISGICTGARYIQEIYLSNNNVSRIESYQFNCAKLRILNLKNSSVEYISTDAFKELYALYHLDVSLNKLKTIEFYFSFDPTSNANDMWNSIQMSSNTQIKINASNNKITDLNLDYVGKNMPNLKQLYLDNNFINNIVSQYSRNNKLSTISLSNNNISKITNNTFKTCSSYITYIDLSKNPLKHIDTGSFSFINHITLNLSESLQHVDINSLNLFKNLCKISSLNINSCNITSLKSNIFQSCHSLRHLNLSGNVISSIDSGAFKGLQSVINVNPQIFLHNVSHLQHEQFSGLILIQELNLSNLGIKSLENNTFHDMTLLKVLNLSNNNIEILVTQTFHKLNVEYINLSNNSIKSIEKKTFSRLTLKSLILSHNQISEFSGDILEKVPALITLDLSFNKIEKISSGAFEFLSNLISLSLNDNNILVLESFCFYKLSALQNLDLRNNYIVNIEPHAFEGISENIKIDYFNLFNQKTINSRGFDGLHFQYFDILNLSHSSIEVIETEAFYGLNYLRLIDLENCNITAIHNRAFTDVVVNELNLANNNISYLDNEAFFGLSVQNLTLNNNNIGILSEVLFSSLALEESVLCCQLMWLYLNNAGLTKIEPYSFSKLNKLVHLDLGNNNLSILQTHTFIGLNDLLTLNLNNNHIINLETNSFLGLPNINILSMSKMDIPLINSSVMEHMPNLTELYLTNNKITVLSPASFKYNRNLQILNLSYNTIIDLQKSTFYDLNTDVLDLNSCRFGNNLFEAGKFTGVINVNTLFLSNCSLHELKSNLFTGLPHLTNLHLDHNNISELQEHIFHGLDNLSNLYLQNNQLKHISCESFKGLNNLKVINLSKNRLYSIAICGFQYFSNLTHLHLESNELSTLRVGIFAALDNIRYLNLSDNILKDFNPFVYYNMPKLEYLDISSNTLYTRSFLHIFKFNSTLSHMENLKYVGLMHNEFPCNNLMDFLKFLKKRKIAYKPVDDHQYETTNIDGIACTHEYVQQKLL